jgi:hypothetical protein
LAVSPTAVVVWELSAATFGEREAVASAIAARGPAVRVVCVAGINSAAARWILWAAERLPWADILLAGFDDVAGRLRKLTRDTQAVAAHACILQHLVPMAAPAVVDIIACAAVIGRRRSSVADLATAMGVAQRTLQWRLSTGGCLPARDVLGWITTLHTCWHLHVCGWPAKRVAAEANFQSPEAWANYCRRHSGRRPKSWLASGGFMVLLEQAAEAMLGLRPTGRQAAK